VLRLPAMTIAHGSADTIAARTRSTLLRPGQRWTFIPFPSAQISSAFTTRRLPFSRDCIRRGKMTGYKTVENRFTRFR
jgi:hypothetical protein